MGSVSVKVTDKLRKHSAHLQSIVAYKKERKPQASFLQLRRGSSKLITGVRPNASSTSSRTTLNSRASVRFTCRFWYYSIAQPHHGLGQKLGVTTARVPPGAGAKSFIFHRSVRASTSMERRAAEQLISPLFLCRLRSRPRPCPPLFFRLKACCFVAPKITRLPPSPTFLFRRLKVVRRDRHRFRR